MSDEIECNCRGFLDPNSDPTCKYHGVWPTIDRLRALLNQLEWSASNIYGCAVCPTCRTRRGSHTPDCALARELNHG